MQVKQFVLSMFQTNCYVVSTEGKTGCILIDPADRADVILEYLKEKQLVPEAILLTHGHYDHFLAVPKLQECFNDLKVYCHPLDCPKEKEEYDMGRVFPTVSAFENVTPIADQEELFLAGYSIKVLHTPGHTPGSVVFLMEDAMFSGDTLFAGSIGRTDFAGGNLQQMKKSLKKLVSLENDFRIYPGHEDYTTLSREKRINPYLKFL